MRNKWVTSNILCQKSADKNKSRLETGNNSFITISTENKRVIQNALIWNSQAQSVNVTVNSHTYLSYEAFSVALWAADLFSVILKVSDEFLYRVYSDPLQWFLYLFESSSSRLLSSLHVIVSNQTKYASCELSRGETTSQYLSCSIWWLQDAKWIQKTSQKTQYITS